MRETRRREIRDFVMRFVTSSDAARLARRLRCLRVRPDVGAGARRRRLRTRTPRAWRGCAYRGGARRHAPTSRRGWPELLGGRSPKVAGEVEPARFSSRAAAALQLSSSSRAAAVPSATSQTADLGRIREPVKMAGSSTRARPSARSDESAAGPLPRPQRVLPVYGLHSRQISRSDQLP